MRDAPTLATLAATLALTAISFLPTGEPAQDAPPDPASTAEITAFLDSYREALAASDEDTLRALYVDDNRFAWLEDGQLRYDSADAILRALAEFGEQMTHETTFSRTRVEPLGTGHAAVHTRFQTSLLRGGQSVYAFDGVITMTLEHSPSGWRILQGHTSTRKQGGR